MDYKHIVDAAIKYIEVLFKDEATGHDFEHTMRVYRTAVDIANNYPEKNMFYIELAALLHDVDDDKIFSTGENENAKKFLKSQKVEQKDIVEIIKIINQVSFSKNKDKKPSSLEACIVQDADRLDAIGAIGIARAFAYGGRNGRPLQDSIDHFYDKLLLIKYRLNTKEAKDMAVKRHQVLLEFLKEYKRELR